MIGLQDHDYKSANYYYCCMYKYNHYNTDTNVKLYCSSKLWPRVGSKHLKAHIKHEDFCSISMVWTNANLIRYSYWLLLQVPIY